MKQKIRKILPNWFVNNFWHWPIALLAAAYYGFPTGKLKLIGVTGTDGKTTIVYLINHILKSAGYRTVMISSVDAELNEKKAPTGFHVTSPHPFNVQKYLKQAVDKKVEYAVLEVTSHAIDQHRFAGCKFKAVVLTNIRPDHLDYHKTFENYKKAKIKFLNKAKIAIRSDNNPIKSISQPDCLPGKYNLSNILAAASVCTKLEINRKTIRNAVKTFPGVPGRFEEVKTGKDFRVIIDFAHTPYALRALLTTIRGQMNNKGKLIAVFGCAAERGKDRRKMGKVSAELADLTIITAEDPRFEGVEKISKDIAQWAIRGGAANINNIKNKHVFTRIPDRQEAINYAVKSAKKGDIVALCGKGHEQSMNFEGVEYPWSEKKAVKRSLNLRQKT